MFDFDLIKLNAIKI